MPTYDYQCEKCENVFEIKRSINDVSSVICPDCNNEKTRKLISIPAITFKGSGFYKNDAKSNTSKTEKKTEPLLHKAVDAKPNTEVTKQSAPSISESFKK